MFYITKQDYLETLPPLLNTRVSIKLMKHNIGDDVCCCQAFTNVHTYK